MTSQRNSQTALPAFSAFSGLKYKKGERHPPTLSRFSRFAVFPLSVFLSRLKIDLFKHRGLQPTRALENSASIFDHAGMPAEIAGRVFGLQPPLVGVFADQIFHAACFAAPVGVFPRAAYCGHVFEPWRFCRELFHFVAIAEFPGAASSLDTKELMASRHRRIAGFPVPEEGAHIADKGSQTRDGGQEQMIAATASQIEGEAAFGDFAAEELIARLEFVQVRRQFALWHKLDEKLQPILLVGGRHYGIEIGRASC